MDLNFIKNLGIAAAYKGAGVLREYALKSDLRVEKKGEVDLVTEADRASERIILDSIRAVYPDHAILAEESGGHIRESEHCWIIDPLDGTTNFTHHTGIYAVSIAYARNGETQVGIVLNPVSGELFTAVVNQGAFLNGRPIRVSRTRSIQDCLLATGFPYDFKHHMHPLMTRLGNCMRQARGIRRMGAAAIDLCFVACGRFDGFWEENLKPWDTAAGMRIVLEAGGRISDFSSQPFHPQMKEVLASNGLIHDTMLTLLHIEGKE